MKALVQKCLRRLAAAAGGEFRSRWEVEAERNREANFPAFIFRGRLLPQVLHVTNCGHDARTATERTVELAIADVWLRAFEPGAVMEIGAVTPYYWPHRVKRVVDPLDPHPFVTDRVGIESVDIHGRNVLCVSTLEHIGTGDYRLESSAEAFHAAARRLLTEPENALITLPLGYHPLVEALLQSPLPPGVRLDYVVRNASSTPPFWEENPRATAAEYPYANGMARAIAVLEKGSAFARARTDDIPPRPRT